jgi:hypothetical protein
MPTDQEHAAVLRAKCRNGTLYRNDAKLGSWLGIPLGEVQSVLDRLVSADVLRPSGISEAATERYTLGLPMALDSPPRGGSSRGGLDQSTECEPAMHDPFDPFASHGSQVSYDPTEDPAFEAALEAHLSTTQPKPKTSDWDGWSFSEDELAQLNQAAATQATCDRLIADPNYDPRLDPWVDGFVPLSER